MAKVKGLVFLGYEKPKPNETFIKKILYRYVPLFDTYNSQKQKRTITTYIELFIYLHKICVISFYNEGFGGEKTRYKVRCKLGAGHIKAIISACLQAYYSLIEREGHHAFVFCASDDIDSHLEFNKRFSMYTRYIDDNFKGKESYIQKGSVQLNTFMLVHRDHQHQTECINFIDKFNKQVLDDIENPEDDQK
ncbi:hypothetical protein GCM10009122_30630 [Fulvivirga kasyanovii]